MNANYLTSPPRKSYQTCSRMTLSESVRTSVVSSNTFRGSRVFFTGCTMISQVGHNVTYLSGRYDTNRPGIHVK